MNDSKTPEKKKTADPLLRTLGRLGRTLEGLEPGERALAMDYLRQRFGGPPQCHAPKLGGNA